MKEQQEKYNLPYGWKWVILDDLCYKITDGSHNPPPKQEVGLPMLSAKNIENYTINFDKDVRLINKEDFGNEQKRTKIEKGDILLTIVGSIGRVAVVERKKEFAIQRSVALIKPILIASKYLMYYFSSPSFQKVLTLNSKGSAQRGIYLSTLKNISIPIPGLDEQDAIVSNIENLFSKLNVTSKLLDKTIGNLKIYKHLLSKSAFEGKLTTNWRKEHIISDSEQIFKTLKTEREDYSTNLISNWYEKIADWESNGKIGLKPSKPKEFEVFSYNNKDFENLSQLPLEWRWIHWNDMLDYKTQSFKRGPFGSALTKSIFMKSGYKVYEQYCAINDDCTFERYFITPEKFEELKAFSVKKDDFLISCAGTIGRITQVPAKYKEGVINQALLRLRLNKKYVNDKFFLYFFRSPYFQKQIFENSKGSAIPNMKGVKELKIIPVPLLSIEEQKVIVEILESRLTLITNLEKTIDNVLSEIAVLKHSILKKAFEGKLVKYVETESVDYLISKIKIEKHRFLQEQKKINSSKPKQKIKMEEKKSILDILKELDTPISVQDLWEKSNSEGDIERFYSEVKEIYEKS